MISPIPSSAANNTSFSASNSNSSSIRSIMSSYDQNHPQVSYPAQAMPPPSAAAPPAGYPTSLNLGTDTAATTTQSRGDGFWKGCCAALCCCCVLDACF